ncbi:MAG: hypothetical protein BWX81_01617 [Spirochaetes bacterium ADurb.Bin110]|nr:MAG: hypothetical protein BWX81_01617 [Spirochaetes bacterium ADurb.Bin110]
MSESKILDYNKQEVRDRLLRALRSYTKEWTSADLARATGLPLAQINAEMPAISDEYRGRIRVSERGDLLYSFPNGFKSKYKGFGPSVRRLWKTITKGAVETGKFLFKVWILVTLFGYFFIFIALALVALFGSVAMRGGGSRDSDDRRGGGGLGGLWLTTNLFDSMIRLWFYSELFKGPETRYRSAQAKAQRRPLHKAVFSHVFGDGDPNAEWDTILKKAFVAFVQTHKGVITLPEFMVISGLKPEEAEDCITRYLVEFEGSPEVTDNGALYFFFPSLLTKTATISGVTASTFPTKKLHRFSSNPEKMDRTFRWVNIFNLVFGSYYLWNAINLGTAIIVQTPEGTGLKGGLSFLYSYTVYLFSMLGANQPVVLVGWLLGVAPLAFSLIFFGIPIIRSQRIKRENEKIKHENMRRVLYSAVIANPDYFDPQSIQLPANEVRPEKTNALLEETQHLAAWSRGEISSEGKWSFSDIEFIEREVERVRASIDEKDYSPQKTVFDTDSPI